MVIPVLLSFMALEAESAQSQSRNLKCWIGILLHYLKQEAKSKCQGGGWQLSFKRPDKLFPFDENLRCTRRDAHVNWARLHRAPWCCNL